MIVLKNMYSVWVTSKNKSERCEKYWMFICRQITFIGPYLADA